MINLSYTVAGQLIEPASVPQYLVADTVGIYQVAFTFDSDWADMGEKTVVFRNPQVIDPDYRDVPVEFPLDANGQALVPAALLDPGKLFIGVYGTNSTQQLPTIWAPPLQVVPGASPGVEPSDDPALGTVIRTIPQTLTEEEKAQARENIGANEIEGGTPGNVVIIDNNLNIADSGKSLSDIYDAAMISKTASGSIVTLTDGADGVPIKEMTVGIQPVQAGSGDPSPSNVRVISGWTQTTVGRTEKNLYQSPLGDIGITPRYISPTGVVAATSDGSACVAVFGIEGGKKYYIYASPTAAIFRFGSKYSASANASGILGQLSAYYRGSAPYRGELQTVSGDNSIIIQMNSSVLNAGARIIISDVPINTYPIEFPTESGTVYDGSLTVREDGTGTMTVDCGFVTYDGSSDEVIQKINNASYNRYTLTTPSDSFLPAVQTNDGVHFNWLITSTVAADYNGNLITNHRFNIYLPLSDSNFTSVAAFRSYLASHPLQATYPLADPITYDLTADQVRTLLFSTLKGLNNIWADTGDISVTYRADPTLATAEQAQAIKESIATDIEDGYTASKAYEVGSYLYVGDTLYVVTSAIASGATITPGTNVSEEPLADGVTGLSEWETASITVNSTYLTSANALYCRVNRKLKIAVLFGWFTIGTIPSGGVTLFTITGIKPFNSYCYTYAHRGASLISMRPTASGSNTNVNVDIGTSGSMATGAHALQIAIISIQ